MWESISTSGYVVKAQTKVYQTGLLKYALYCTLNGHIRPYPNSSINMWCTVFWATVGYSPSEVNLFGILVMKELYLGSKILDFFIKFKDLLEMGKT